MLYVAKTLLSASKTLSVNLDDLLTHSLAQHFIFGSKSEELLSVWFFEGVQFFLVSHLHSQSAYVLAWHPFIFFGWNFQRDELKFVELLVDYLGVYLFASYTKILQKVFFGVFRVSLPYDNSFFCLNVFLDTNIDNASSGIKKTANGFEQSISKKPVIGIIIVFVLLNEGLGLVNDLIFVEERSAAEVIIWRIIL